MNKKELMLEIGKMVDFYQLYFHRRMMAHDIKQNVITLN